jgi:beta-glucosidase
MGEGSTVRQSITAALAAMLLVVGCSGPTPSPSATPTLAIATPARATPAPPTPSAAPSPTAQASAPSRPGYLDPDQPLPARVADLLGRMTLDEKVGQMTLIERGELFDPHAVAAFGLGAVLSGGGSSPTPNTPQAWADMIDAFQQAALSTRLGIPILYGTDSVHGDGNLHDATIFPHNIGLGAAGDLQMVRDIGRATAEETAATGANWTFSPCVCVARDIRWGRTYESYSEDPGSVAGFASAIVPGYQGPSLGQGTASILATAKHYIGDGGTVNGTNEGDVQMPEDELLATFLPPYRAAVDAGVGSIMISFSSVNGLTMHADAHLINDVLKTELGFDGFVVSDWAGINRIDGIAISPSPIDISTAVNAGVDMIMVPTGAAPFEQMLKADIQGGDIPMSRVDDAVGRILGQKFRLGLFEHPLADRSLAASIRSAEHLALARRAVAESLVVLKNAGAILPLKNDARILVAGKNADNIGAQLGGWTITWQGGNGPTTAGTSILEGIREVAGDGSTIDFDVAGNGAEGHDVAIAVLGEEPYAEGEGDRNGDLGLDITDLAVLARLAASGVPIVLVLVSGRPLVVTDQLPEVDALVAAWLPGTEGAGVADVLFGRTAATGRLAFSWPRFAAQLPLNVGADAYDPLFRFGFGMDIAAAQ